MVHSTVPGSTVPGSYCGLLVEQRKQEAVPSILCFHHSTVAQKCYCRPFYFNYHANANKWAQLNANKLTRLNKQIHSFVLN